MARNYKTVEEITEAFIKQGWSVETAKFEELTIEKAEAMGLGSDTIYKIMDGKKLFIMTSTGNVYDNKGDIYWFNIHCVKAH